MTLPETLFRYVKLAESFLNPASVNYPPKRLCDKAREGRDGGRLFWDQLSFKACFTTPIYLYPTATWTWIQFFISTICANCSVRLPSQQAGGIWAAQPCCWQLQSCIDLPNL
jgi:hypothetical protein